MALPKLLVIGAQKAGTSWLHQTLAQHPMVWVPPFKELHFFDHKFVLANRKWTHAHVERGVAEARARHLAKGKPNSAYLEYLEAIARRPMFNRNWYRHVFSACPEDRLGVDVTPEYCSVPFNGISFIRSFLPETKFIYLVRHPVSRAVSQLIMNAARRKIQPKTEAEWLRLAAEPVIHDRGNYAEYVPLWDKHVPADLLLYLPFGDIASRPRDLLRTVENFVGLPPAAYPGADQKVYEGVGTPIPEGVVAYFEERFVGQIAFLKERFGEEFFLRTGSGPKAQ